MLSKEQYKKYLKQKEVARDYHKKMETLRENYKPSMEEYYIDIAKYSDDAYIDRLINSKFEIYVDELEDF